MIRIGLIEDNIEYRDNLAFLLRRESFEIVFESDGRNVDRTLEEHPCDLILLDLGLPEEDGLAIARRLRLQQPALGIVMLTARCTLDDRVIGMNDGADAYLVKPVEFRELVAVLKSVLRRAGVGAKSIEVPVNNPHDWLLQPARLQLVSPEGLLIKLTGKEAKLLSHMVQVYPEAASRRALAESNDAILDSLEFRPIEVALSRLRKKIQDTTGQTLILALRSEGYLFGAPIRLDDKL